MRFDGEWEDDLYWNESSPEWNERMQGALREARGQAAALRSDRLQLLRLALKDPGQALEHLHDQDVQMPPVPKEKLSAATPWNALLRRAASPEGSLPALPASDIAQAPEVQAALQKAVRHIRSVTHLPDRIVEAELSERLSQNRVSRASAVSSVRFLRDEAALAPAGWTQCAECDWEPGDLFDTCPECGTPRR